MEPSRDRWVPAAAPAGRLWANPMSTETFLLIANIVLLLGSVAMAIRPQSFVGRGTPDVKGLRIAGIIFTMIGLFNLIDRLQSNSQGA